MSDQVQPLIADNDLAFIDGLIGQMDAATTKGGKDSDLSVVFLGDCAFTMRIVLDKKRQLYNEFRMYSERIKSKNEKGEEVERKIKYRAPMAWDDDPIQPYAVEVDNYMHSARYHTTFFGDIVDITRGESEYFKKGPCILVANNKRFLDSLKVAMQVLAKMGDKGKRAIADSLDPNRVGYLVNVDSSKGTQGSVKIQYITFGDPIHKFDPKIADQFNDITTAYCPPTGPENDKNSLLIIEHYKELIKLKATQVDPTPAAKAELAAQDKLGVQPPAANSVAPPTTVTPTPAATPVVTPPPQVATKVSNPLDDLDAALNAAGIPK